MFNFRQNHITAIQIKDHIIRYVSVKNTSEAPIEKYGEVFLPPGIVEKGNIIDADKFNDILASAIKKWELTNKKVKFVVPDNMLFFRKLTIPSNIEENEIRGYLNFEVGNTIHLPFDDPHFDYHIIEESEDGQAVLLFAISEKAINQYTDKLDKLRVVPKSAEIASLSIYQLFDKHFHTKELEHYLCVNWDLTSINLSIYHLNKPVFMRELNYSFNSNDWSIEQSDQVVHFAIKEMDNLKFQIEEQLKEVSRIMNFYKYTMNQGNEDITSIILTGDHPSLSLIKDQLKQFDVNVFTLEEVKIDVPKQFVVTSSLCLKEV